MNCSAQRHGPVKKVFGTKLFSVVEMRYARRIEPSVAWVADDAGCDGRAVHRPRPGWGKTCQMCRELSLPAAIGHGCPERN